MAKMVVVLEWDEKELGKDWMNKYNLDLLLFTSSFTPRELLKVEVLATESEKTIEIKMQEAPL